MRRQMRSAGGNDTQEAGTFTGQIWMKTFVWKGCWPGDGRKRVARESFVVQSVAGGQTGR